MLEDSQRMDVTDFWVRSYIPTSSSEASDSDVSPSLVDSDEIRREFGPRANPDANAGDDLLEDDDAILLQTPAAGSSDPIPTAAQAVGQIVNDSCLLGTHPYWLRALSAAFLQDAAIERADIGPTALLTAWYIDASAESTNEDSHAIQLDHQANLWAHDIQQLWQDKVQPDHRVYFAWVNPKPRESPLARTLGHLFVFQKPQETLAPVLMTFHFQALNMDGVGHAVAVIRHAASPVDIVHVVKLERVCHRRRCTLHRGTPGKRWVNPLPPVKVSSLPFHRLEVDLILNCTGD